MFGFHWRTIGSRVKEAWLHRVACCQGERTSECVDGSEAVSWHGANLNSSQEDHLRPTGRALENKG